MTPAGSWSIERDGKIYKTGSSIEVLGAGLNAVLAGLLEVVRRRPRPSYEERIAVFKPTGRPEPSRDPYSTARPGARLRKKQR